MKAFDFSRIDWSELRNQKRTLLQVITELEKGFKSGTVEGNANEVVNNLTGILHLIDSIQDYAVDELGMNENNIFDFEQEDPEYNSNLNF
jgi:hypothetical protein